MRTWANQKERKRWKPSRSLDLNNDYILPEDRTKLPGYQRKQKTVRAWTLFRSSPAPQPHRLVPHSMSLLHRFERLQAEKKRSLIVRTQVCRERKDCELRLEKKRSTRLERECNIRVSRKGTGGRKARHGKHGKDSSNVPTVFANTLKTNKITSYKIPFPKSEYHDQRQRDCNIIYIPSGSNIRVAWGILYPSGNPDFQLYPSDNNVLPALRSGKWELRSANLPTFI
jgi:hypothetical protein